VLYGYRNQSVKRRAPVGAGAFVRVAGGCAACSRNSSDGGDDGRLQDADGRRARRQPAAALDEEGTRRPHQGDRRRRRRQQRRQPHGRRRLDGVEFIVANTDLQALAANAAPVKLQIGSKLTKGSAPAPIPNVGRQAALEDTDKIIQALDGADMIFVTTGLGGGTGTGAAPVIASLASELGALTIAVVTKPFKFEGKKRQIQAERGLEALRDCVDTIITIPNERLLTIIDRTTPLTDAFATADDVLRQAIQGISDLILVPGLINLDFADVKTIMAGMGSR
jgi:cell division protein FtsZ